MSSLVNWLLKIQFRRMRDWIEEIWRNKSWTSKRNIPRNIGLAGEEGIEGFKSSFGVEIWEGDGHFVWKWESSCEVNSAEAPKQRARHRERHTCRWFAIYIIGAETLDRLRPASETESIFWQSNSNLTFKKRRIK